MPRFIKGADGKLYCVTSAGIQTASHASPVISHEGKILSKEMRDDSFGAMAHTFLF